MTNFVRNYDIFSGEDLKIADRIQLLRLRLLVHSCIYYELNKNTISDKEWDSMAKELVQLQSQYEPIAKKVMWYEAFKNWDGSTGMDLPLREPWVLSTARKLLGYGSYPRLNARYTAEKGHCVPNKPKTKKVGRLF